jgi:hypothetical protein
MPGETNLKHLLMNMQPELLEEEFVYCSISPISVAQLDYLPRGVFHEAEGMTLIVEKSIADAEQLEYSFVARMITLNVHSSLEAVGFLAAISTELARAGISANVISALYHDHLFVPAVRAEEAMAILSKLSHDAAGDDSGS